MIHGMIERRFLGSNTHLLHALAKDLADRHRAGGVVDLSRTVVMLPTSRAPRCLEMRLLHETASDLLTPPILLTPASLLDHIIVPRRTIASRLASDMAWLDVVRMLDETDRRTLLGHSDPMSVAESHALGNRLAGVSRDLAAAFMTPAEVVSRCEERGVPVDTARWAIIAGLHGAMMESLAAQGLDDRDAAHRQAIDESRLHLHAIDQITTISADLPPRLRRVLNMIADQGIRVENIVHGEKSDLGDTILPDGTVDIDAWCEQAIDIDHVDVAAQTKDQIAVAFEHLAAMAPDGEGIGAREVRLVVPDETLLGPLRGAAMAEGVPLEHFEGDTLDQSPVGRFVVLLRDVAESESASALSALIRHPAVTSWLLRQGVSDPVITWDAMWRTHVPGPIACLTEIVQGTGASAVVEPLVHLTDPLMQPRPLADWAGVLLQLLTKVFDDGEPITDATTRMFDAMHGVLTELHEHPPGEAVAACDALTLVMRQLETIAATQHVKTGGLDVIGWLDAHLDDAPHIIVTGLNEGTIPAPVGVDAWLPDANRRALGLPDRRAREARDAFLLRSMLQSGRDVRLVCARKASDGEPLPPSRLLLRASGRALAERVLSIIGPSASEGVSTLAARRTIVDRDCLFDPYPLPSGDPIIRSMSVTSFSLFIKDPYAFLIERDARIKAQDVKLEYQLDAMGFGNMLHDSLEQWGREELDRDAPTTDAERIASDMCHALDHHIKTTFGSIVAPGVRLQVAMARHRLAALARVQAARASAGWRIHQIEHFFGPPKFADSPWPIFPNDKGLYLTGRIDRVDVHETHGYQALDYKSGRKAEGPDKVHRTKNGWKDLQLPLYRVLLRSIGIEVPSHGLGYVLVPPQESLCRIAIARWTETDLNEAEAEAAEIVRIVSQGRLLEVAEASLE